MRTFFAGVAALAFGAAAVHAGEFIPFGPATFQFDAITQTTPFHLVSSNASATATATNIMTLRSATVASTHFATSNLLALLANSLKTSVPAGSQIGFSLGGFVVLDKTGSNVFPNLSTVLTITNNDDVFSEKDTEIQTTDQNSSSISGNNNATVTSDVTIIYDDTTVSPVDGTNSTFQLTGLLVEKISTNLKNGFTKINYLFEGSGWGLVHGVTNVLSGTIKENAAGAPLD